jgi:hypothetical protein
MRFIAIAAIIPQNDAPGQIARGQVCLALTAGAATRAAGISTRSRATHAGEGCITPALAARKTATSSCSPTPCD